MTKKKKPQDAYVTRIKKISRCICDKNHKSQNEYVTRITNLKMHTEQRRNHKCQDVYVKNLKAVHI